LPYVSLTEACVSPEGGALQRCGPSKGEGKGKHRPQSHSTLPPQAKGGSGQAKDRPTAPNSRYCIPCPLGEYACGGGGSTLRK
jgi:hypothetical protein